MSYQVDSTGSNTVQGILVLALIFIAFWIFNDEERTGMALTRGRKALKDSSGTFRQSMDEFAEALEELAKMLR